jgi:predicted Zn-dependent protease
MLWLRREKMAEARRKGLVRDLVDFALNRDVAAEIEAQHRILRADPLSAEARLNLGVLFYSQGMIEDAIRELLMSIECDKSQPTAFRRLGEIYIGLGDLAQAGMYARMAADRGDATLLDAFKRYPAVESYVDDQVV